MNIAPGSLNNGAMFKNHGSVPFDFAIPLNGTAHVFHNKAALSVCRSEGVRRCMLHNG